MKQIAATFENYKKLSTNVFTIYDVHENMNALYRTFSERYFVIKELAIMKRNLNETNILNLLTK